MADWTDIADLNYDVKELWRYQIDTLKMWAEIVDGFRCDVAQRVPVEFWKQAREEVATVRPGAIWLAESSDKRFVKFIRIFAVKMTPKAWRNSSTMYGCINFCRQER